MHARLSRLRWQGLVQIFFVLCSLQFALPTFAKQPSLPSQEFTVDHARQVRSVAVPAGLSSSDWAGIRAHVQVAENSAGLSPEAVSVTDLPLIDLGFVEQSYLKASNTHGSDKFGYTVALDGDTLAVGAIWENGASPGVNGDQETRGANRSGAVYVFTFDGKTWAQQAYVKASNPGLEDYFGQALALSGDTLVVGSPRERSGTGDQGDNSLPGAGAVYVFTRDAGVWSQQAYLKAPNIDNLDYFGWSVDIDGDTLVASAYEEDGSATGVNGAVNNSTTNAGAAYVFTRSGETWSQPAYLKASNTGEGDKFGHSVAISGNTIVVGVPLEDSSATGVDGSQGDNSATDAGAVYVFTRSEEAWSQQAYLKASNTDPGDQFGFTVAIESDTLVVGANYEDSNGTQSGAAYVFHRSGDAWTQQAFLTASNAQKGDRFGDKVSISGDMLLVAAYGESSNATGVDGNQLNNSIANAGAVYVFSRRDAVWSQKAYLKQFPSGRGQDGFSNSLAISGGIVLVGANKENSNATGVDGDQFNTLAPQSGAAYTFIADLYFKDSYED